MSINSLGLIENLQIAATGLKPGKNYKLVLVGGSQPQDLIAFSAGIGGAAVSQTLRPLKRAVAGSPDEGAMRLEVRSSDGGLGELILRQVEATKNNPQ